MRSPAVFVLLLFCLALQPAGGVIASEAGSYLAPPDPGANRSSYRYAYGPDDFPAEINPLTGLPADDPALLERRPIAIKVTNFPRSVRPQWGLSLADHVYEYYIADEMTRFVGIFYGKDASRVGPVRSARLFDERLMRMYKAIFVFGWADDPVLEFLTAPDIRPYLVVERAKNCPPLCRIGPKYAYNNLFADTAQIAAYLKERRSNNDRQDLAGLRFEADVPKSGHIAQSFSVRYSPVSYHRWDYDPTQARYLRYQDSVDDFGKGASYAPLSDSLTGAQLSAANVVILLMPHTYYLRYSKTDIIDQVFSGQGYGYALRDGQLYPLTWNREGEDEMLRLALPNGQPFPLKPGNTWFEVLSDLSTLEQQGESGWHFDFVLPEE
ncbi:MAG: DUF3048 domain-containing protein [Anaerolineales bacterium]|nr:DUF3048 domain-containing protein [Anaerolineales bacterium]